MENTTDLEGSILIFAAILVLVSAIGAGILAAGFANFLIGLTVKKLFSPKKKRGKSHV